MEEKTKTVEIRRPDSLESDIYDTPKEFQSYLFNKLGDDWLQKYITAFFDNEVLVFGFIHPEKEKSLIVDEFQLYVWVKGKGFALISHKPNIDRSRSFRGALHHGVKFSVDMSETDSNALVFSVEVNDVFYEWNVKHDLKVKSHKDHRFAFKESIQ